MANVKITALTDIGANILYTALIPMVNMAGTPTTQQGNIQILGNYILSGAGTANFAPARLSNIAYTVANAAQPNITSVGTLTSLAVSGNVTSNGYITANFFVGDGSLLTNIAGAGGSFIANGTSNVSIPTAGGNILFTRGGTANVVAISGTGAEVNGTLNVTGNANTGNIGATTGVFTNILGTLTTASQTNITAVGTLNTLTVAGNANTGNIGANRGVFTTVSATNLNVSGNVTSNLLPNANVTYNLGSSTQRWNDIWLANSTIYLGDSTISAGSGNSIVFSGPLQTDGNITANTGDDVIIRTLTGNTPHTWSFGADGNLTLPNNTFAVNYANGSPVQIGGGGSGNSIGNFVVSGNMFMLDSPNLDMVIQQSAGDMTSIRLIPDGHPQSGIHLETGAMPNMWHWIFSDTGNLIAPGNVELDGTQLFVGPGAVALPNIANSTLVISSNSEAFIQAIINNVSDVGSADWIAQGHYGDDDGGYIDMGFNSAAHNDPDYSLTGPGDGYILVEGYYPGQAPVVGGGSLILATGVEGTTRDVIIGLGGYTSANLFAKFSDANNALELSRAGANFVLPGSIVMEGTGSIESGNLAMLLSADANNSVDIFTTDGNATHTWSFGSDGNLTLPSNTFAVNYANGDAIVLGGNTIGNFVVSGNMFMLNDPNIDMVIQQSASDMTSIRLIPDGTPDSGVHIETGAMPNMWHWHFEDTGNFIAPGNVIMDGTQILVGPGADTLPNVANATLVISSNSSAFVQAIINNVSDVGTADWVALGHYGDDNGGYIDMGFSSAAYNDPTQDIVGPGDGYVFAEGYYPGQAPVIGGGNLVLATGNEGQYKDIIFGLNGYTSGNIFAKFSHNNNAFELTRNGANIVLSNGGVIFGNDTAVLANGSGDIQAYVQSSGFGIQTYSANTYKTWTFDNGGNFVLPGNTFAVNYANGTQASAPLVDVLNTNGLTTVFYPTFVEDRTDGQIVRADVDLSYRSDTNTLTVGNIVANNLGNISSINIDGNVSNVLTGNGTFVALPVINANTVVWTDVPVSNTAVGIPGQAAYDSGGNLYICVSANTWSKFSGNTSW